MNTFQTITKMMTTMNEGRRNYIKRKVLEVLSNYGEITLPVPIKKIVKAISKCRLISYSRFMKDRQISYSTAIECLGSQDACCDYDSISGQCIIYYNDCMYNKVSSNRYRWNIAHELGHLVLEHHSLSEKTRIFRNALSYSEYQNLEEEADAFAAYILVPHAILINFGIKNSDDLKNICQISGIAAKRRFNEFLLWNRRTRGSLDEYDLKIKKIFYTASCNQKYIYCPQCSYPTGYTNFHVCPICGNTTARLNVRGADFMKTYPGVPTNENKKVLTCPCCGNEEFEAEGDYCPICGTFLFNHCVDTIKTDDGINHSQEACEQGKILPSNYRFCPYCGNETYFYQMGFLKNWDSSKTQDFEIVPDDAGLLF